MSTRTLIYDADTKEAARLACEVLNRRYIHSPGFTVLNDYQVHCNKPVNDIAFFAYEGFIEGFFEGVKIGGMYKDQQRGARGRFASGRTQ